MRPKQRVSALIFGLATLAGLYSSLSPTNPVAPEQSEPGEPELVLMPFLPTVVRELVPIEGQLLIYSPQADVKLESLLVRVDGNVLFEKSLSVELEGDPEYGAINALIERLPLEITELHRARRYFATANEAELRGPEVLEGLRDVHERVNAMRDGWGRGASIPFTQQDLRLELGEIFEPGAEGVQARVEFELSYLASNGNRVTQSIASSLTKLAPWTSAASTASLAVGVPVTIHAGDLHVHSCHGEAAGACAPSSNCAAETLQLSGSFSYAALKSQYQALGLEWFTATDHSYCVNSTGEFDAIRGELAAITDASFLALPDLEVSSDEVGPQSGSDLGDALCLGFTSANHMGAHDLMHRIEGGGEGFAGFCDGLFSDVLDDFIANAANVRGQGGYPIINHPDASSFGWNSFAATQGQEANSLHGVEIWNGEFQSGQGGNVGAWVNWLLAGRVLYAYSGSDTHDEAFSFGANHALLIDEALTSDNIHAALRAGRCYVSNGPSLILEANFGGQTLLMGAQHPLSSSPPASPLNLRVHYDFGAETGTITILEGKVGDAAESVLCQSGPLTGSGVFDCADVLTTNVRSWYRAYAENTGVSQTAYTNPVFFEPGAAPLFPSFCFGDGGDGMGCTNCPCGNNATVGSQGGCLNSSATSAELLVSGTPSVTNDTIRIEMADGNPGTFAVLVSGDNRLPTNTASPCFYLGSGSLAATLDGLRCMGGNFRRHGTRPIDANGAVGVTTPGWGGMDGPAVGLIAHGGSVAGQTRHWQSFYREDNALGCNTGLNTTQGVSATFAP